MAPEGSFPCGTLAQVIARDPSYSMALIDLAFANHFEAVFGWGDRLEESHAQFGDAARAAVAANDNDAMAQAALALYELFSSRHAEAERRLRRALVLDPNLAFAHGILGGITPLAATIRSPLDERTREGDDHPARLWPLGRSRSPWCRG